MSRRKRAAHEYPSFFTLAEIIALNSHTVRDYIAKLYFYCDNLLLKRIVKNFDLLKPSRLHHYINETLLHVYALVSRLQIYFFNHIPSNRERLLIRNIH